MEVPTSGIPRLPNQEQLEEAIKEFKAIKWDNVALENVEKVVPWPLKAMLFIMVGREIDNYIYRVRSYHSFPSKCLKEDNIFRVKSFSYPPKATLSRAGTIENPVFYGASNLECALIESKSEDTLNFVGCWKIKQEYQINIRPYIHGIKQQIRQSTDTYIPKMEEELNNLYSYYSAEEQAIVKRISEFQDQQFTRYGSADIHKFSSWLANWNFNFPAQVGYPQLDAIMYQSAIENTLGTNLAIRPGFVNDCMELKKVYLVSHLFNPNENKFYRIIFSVGNVNGNAIVWEKSNEEALNEFIQEHNQNFHAIKNPNFNQ